MNFAVVVVVVFLTFFFGAEISPYFFSLAVLATILICFVLFFFCALLLQFFSVLFYKFGRSHLGGRGILLIGLTDSGKTLLFSRVNMVLHH